MKLRKILPEKSEPSSAVIQRSEIIIPSQEVYSLLETPNQNVLIANLLKGGLGFENAFRAKELYKYLTHKLDNVHRLDSLLEQAEQVHISRALCNLKSLAKEDGSLPSQNLSCEDAEALAKLAIKLEVLEEQAEEQKERRLLVSSSLNSVINSIADKIITIMLQDALQRGSYINLGISLARLNPIWEIPDERELTKYLKSKVVTDEFRKCLLESIKGNKPDIESLDKMQKQFFYMANTMIWLLMHIPGFAINHLPTTAKLTRISRNIIYYIPIIGSLIDPFLGPVDEAIYIMWKNEREINLMKKVYREARQQDKPRRFTFKALRARFLKPKTQNVETKSEG